MHSVPAALGVIREAVRPLEVATCALAEASGRVLREALRLDRDSPPFDKALVDGYALRAADSGIETKLTVVGHHDAGGAAAARVAPGTAVAINTGAVVPAGADAIVMVEKTTRAGDRVTLRSAVKAGDGIERRGTHGLAGDVALARGVRLNSAGLGVAATVGATTLRVSALPRVAVLVTGDELIDPSATPTGGEIRNSNASIMLHEMQRCGALVTDLGMARDEPEKIRERISAGFAAADAVMISGGMSMGTRDWVPRVLVEMGVDVLIQKVAIKPGKPFLFGVLERSGVRKYVVGLPGNPVSGFVCLRRFVRPLMDGLVGATERPALLQARCTSALRANGDREFYQPATWGEAGLTPLPWRGSADLFTLARADGLIVHPVGAPARGAGTLVDFIPLGL
jgi:molybdopterin molybdotransferase